MEQLQDVLTAYQEQLQAHHQWLSDHQDLLTALKDSNGSKQVLASRLTSVDSFNDELAGQKQGLDEMEEDLQKILRRLPARSRESVEREISNLK